jgi:predicted dehydrogenase
VSDASRDREANWRLDDELSTGLAGEQGSHQIDVVDWYTEEIPESIIGAGSIRLHNDGRKVADTISLMLRYKAGWSMTYNASLANSFQGAHEIFRGTNAAIKLGWTHGWMFKEADAPTQGWEVYANRQQFHKDEGITLIADATKLASQGKLAAGVGLEHPSLYYGLWEFFASIAGDGGAGGKPAACDIDAGHRAAVLSILANQAVVSGSAVKVDPAVVRGA